MRAAFPIAVLLLMIPPRPVDAQVRDTTRVDTMAVDTTVAPADSAAPPPIIAELPVADTIGGFAAGIWIWTREQLLDQQAVSVLDLLARVPGVATFRTGVYLQPEAASAYGTGPDRLRVELNGYVLDPLLETTPDLSTIQLANLYEVRVERRADLLVVKLRTEAARDARPYSRIEAGVGEPKANVFRGILIAPRFITGPIGLAVQRVELQSVPVQPADAFAGWLRWGWLSENRGVELEVSSQRIDRDAGSPRPERLQRSDVVIRGRNRFGPGLVAEAYLGQSSLQRDEVDLSKADSLLEHSDRKVAQAGVRAGFEHGLLNAEAALRWRDHRSLPRIEAEIASGYRTGRLSLRGSVTHQRWDSGDDATSWDVRAAVPLPAGFAAFAEYADGKRGAPTFDPDTLVTGPRIFERTVYRAGLETGFRGLTAAAAAIRMETDGLAVFGFPGDTLQTVAGGSVTGWEGTIRIPLLGQWLAAAGSYSTWLSGSRWTYLPASMAHGGLLLDATPLESGNLQFVGRLEVARRGIMLAPSDPASPVEVPGRSIINAAIEIRIIDVRIFARFDDMAGQDVTDLPDLVIRGPRILYGVKWSFWN